MRSYTFTDELLNSAREQGDPLADTTITEIFADGRVERVNALFRDFDQNFERPPEDLPPALHHYLVESATLPAWADKARYERGNDLLGRYAPQLVVGMLCASLTTCYVCVDASRVLGLSQRLNDYGYRRIMETAQFVLDIFDEGALEPTGYGMRSIQKIRLLHATIRYHVRQDPRWSPTWGVPVNQEDMVMTMLTNSILGLQALERLGVDLEDDQKESFVHVWNVAGHLLGIDARLLPDTYQDGEALLAKILVRHQGASETGRMLTRTLLTVLAEVIPGKVLDGMPATLIRYFVGDKIADMLAVPAADWTRVLIPPLRGISYITDELGDRSERLAGLFGIIGRNVLKGMFRAMRGPNRFDWRIPRSVSERWGLDAQP